MVVVSSTVAVGPIAKTLDAQSAPIGAPDAGGVPARVADDLAWWTSAARKQRLKSPCLTKWRRSLPALHVSSRPFSARREVR
jgi:hypothetical protein